MSTNQSMQIFSIISQIEQVVENSPRPKLGGNTKRMVDVDEIFDLLGDLKVTIPEDIRRANSVLIDADNIIAHAEEHANELVADAQSHADSLVADAEEQARAMAEEAERQFEQRISEHEVTAEAERRASLLARKAENNANIVYEGAKQYADEILADLQRFLIQYQNLVAENRVELNVHANHQPVVPQGQPAAEEAPVVQPVSRSERRKAPEPAPADEEADFEDEELEPRKPRFNWFKHKPREEDFEDFDEEEDAYDASKQRGDEYVEKRSRHLRILGLENVYGGQCEDGSCHHGSRTGSDALYYDILAHCILPLGGSGHANSDDGNRNGGLKHLAHP